MQRPILAIDFDGVIHKYDGWKGPRTLNEEAVSGAIPFLLDALEEFDVAIFSSRSRYWGVRRVMRKWLIARIEHHFNYDPLGALLHWRHRTRRFADNTDPFFNNPHKIAKTIVSAIDFPLDKPPAHLTLDDRAWCFDGNWPSLESIANFKPWWKEKS